MGLSFDVDFAVEYGLNEAIMFHEILKYIECAHGCRDNFYCQGKYWMVVTIDSFIKVFPFWKEQNIRKTIKSLVSKDLIIKENFGSDKLNKTIWLTIKY